QDGDEGPRRAERPGGARQAGVAIDADLDLGGGKGGIGRIHGAILEQPSIGRTGFRMMHKGLRPAYPAGSGKACQKGSVMRPRLLMWILWLAIVGLRCDDPNPPAPKPDPKPGESVKLRGTLGEDVDCRVFHTDGGKTY